MEYTVQKLSRLAGISARTIRYYDEIGILMPARINSSGYRIYGQAEVDRLQQIMFYKEMGVSLDDIRDIITAPSFDVLQALKKHREKLLEKRKQLDLLIGNVDKTIASKEGGMKMTDKEKFEGFKQKLLEDNEKKYGDEIRRKYGNDIVNKSNEGFKNMTQEEYETMTGLEKQVKEVLFQAYKTCDPASNLAQKAADLHKQWITLCWGQYSKEAHAGLAQMYVDDERFRAYYDEELPGTAVFLRDAIRIYTGIKE